MANLITGLFDTQDAAENALRQLKGIGYGENELTVIAKDRGVAEDVAHESGTRTMSGVGEGAVIGGAIGAIILGILGVAGSVLIPGVGLIVAGSAAAAWAGVGMGAVAGGIIGWLVNLGVPSEVAPYYEQGLNEGAIVLAVAAHPGDENRVEQILKGGSVAYSGHGVQPYVAPEYASRYSDVGPQPKAYDSVNNMQYNTAANAPEAQRTANSVEAEQRSDIRTAAEHEREARRDAERTNPVSGTVAAAENEWDRTKTAVQNQSDKVSTGAQNETDRLNRP